MNVDELPDRVVYALDNAGTAITNMPALYGGREDGDWEIDEAHAPAIAEAAVGAFLRHMLTGYTVHPATNTLHIIVAGTGEGYAVHPASIPEPLYVLVRSLIQARDVL